MNNLTTQFFRAGAWIFEDDNLVARATQTVTFSGFRNLYELPLPGEAPARLPYGAQGLEAVSATEEVRVARLVLDYERGGMQVWVNYGAKLNLNDLVHSEMLTVPKDPSVVGRTEPLSHQALADACRVLLEGVQKYQFGYFTDPDNGERKLQYALEMHEHYAERGAKL